MRTWNGVQTAKRVQMPQTDLPATAKHKDSSLLTRHHTRQGTKANHPTPRTSTHKQQDNSYSSSHTTHRTSCRGETRRHHDICLSVHVDEVNQTRELLHVRVHRDVAVDLDVEEVNIVLVDTSRLCQTRHSGAQACAGVGSKGCCCWCNVANIVCIPSGTAR